MNTPYQRMAVTATTVVSADHPLSAEELARACGAHLDWVRQLADAGILQPPKAAPVPDWRFHSEDLRSALEVRRLERDFDAGIDAAALILDMGHEIRRLKALLSAHGLHHG